MTQLYLLRDFLREITLFIFTEPIIMPSTQSYYMCHLFLLIALHLNTVKIIIDFKDCNTFVNCYITSLGISFTKPLSNRVRNLQINNSMLNDK